MTSDDFEDEIRPRPISRFRMWLHTLRGQWGQTVTPCPACGGDGDETCPRCGGRGEVGWNPDDFPEGYDLT